MFQLLNKYRSAIAAFVIAVSCMIIALFFTIDADSAESDFPEATGVVTAAVIERFGDDSSDYFELRITLDEEFQFYQRRPEEGELELMAGSIRSGEVAELRYVEEGEWDKFVALKQGEFVVLSFEDFLESQKVIRQVIFAVSGGFIILAILMGLFVYSREKPVEAPIGMVKLYKLTESESNYWETWENEGIRIVHWGVLGTRGESKEVDASISKNPEKFVRKEIDHRIKEGYQLIEEDEHRVLMIEFKVEGMGSNQDLEKRHRLQSRMDETLGWTGLGHCDGGSIGSGTMEVCCLVVDFDVAKKVIENDLVGTEFSDCSRIYDEEEVLPSQNIDLEAYPELNKILVNLISGMHEFMSEADVEYSERHISKCMDILVSHFSGVSNALDRVAALECVKMTVLKLNELNEGVDHGLIETVEREQICEFIIKTGANFGFNGEDEDITEEWREW